jgi:hypothetical protein
MTPYPFRLISLQRSSIHYVFLSSHALYLTRFALSDAKKSPVVVNKKAGHRCPA